jgi:glycosyltransferase involved in cell wall biosynthesis
VKKRKASGPQVSVIVPIYNVEAWLPACLDSLLGQSLKAWEAILVDDGSTDGSAKIAADYAAGDSRFKLVQQKNTGLGGARNTGCRHARGEYLCFLDSDDLLGRNALQGMLEVAGRADADMVVADFHTFIDGEAINPAREYAAAPHFARLFGAYPAVFRWQDMQGNIDLLYFGNYFCVVWGKLFRRSLWEKLGCESPSNLRMAEDFIAVKKFAFGARRITTYPQAALLYRKRAGSATTHRTSKTFEVFRAYEYAVQMFKDAGVYEGQFNSIHLFFLQMLVNHMLWFTPYRNWYGFYRRAQRIIAGWDETRMEAALRDRVLQFKQRPRYTFLRMGGEYIWHNKVKPWLPLKSRIAIG